MVAGPALAVAPANDEYPERVTLSGGLPLDYTQDTSEATLGLDDAAFVAGCDGVPPTDASVWFQYTAVASGGLVLDMTASGYSAGAVIAMGNPTDGWQVAGCGPGVAGWYADEGVTYTMLVFDDQSDEAGNGGLLDMTLDVIPPPPTIDLTVNPVGTFNSRTGEATISGMVTCDPGDNAFTFAEVDVEATQRVGRFLIKGYSYQEIACNGETVPWSATVVGETGLFKGGKAMTVTVGYGCGDYDCSINFVESVVMLRGGKR